MTLRHSRRALLLGSLSALAVPAIAQADDGDEVIGFVNAYRAANRLPPVALQARLMLAAQRHAEDMARRRMLDHVGSDGVTMDGRARRVGYRYLLLVENVAMGQRSPREAVRGWAASPPHRANMLADVIEGGAGRARSGEDYWVLVLATPMR